jgi:2-oxoisovalerate dehydrogenase E1 component
MRRYAAFDPPEYQGWTADEGLLEAFRECFESDPDRHRVVEKLGSPELLSLYRGMLRFRLHDIMLQRWVKQGVISKAWLGTGEEAVTIGAVHALRRGQGQSPDVVGPMIRNAGACHEMGMPMSSMFQGYLGALEGPARGRDLHIGDSELGIVAPVSVVGGLCGVMNGYALAFRMAGEERVALTWIGDGSTKSGEVHEALNFASVNRLPVIFVLQNNQIALGTRLGQHHRADGFSAWGRAYGAELLEVDGNNVLDMYAATTLAVARCRRGEGPVFLAAETFRMGGHATHDVREARELIPAAQFEYWGRRDPIGQFEEWLVTGRVDLETSGTDTRVGDPSERERRNREVLARIEEDVVQEVDEAAEEALAGRRDEDSAPSPQSGEGTYA